MGEFDSQVTTTLFPKPGMPRAEFICSLPPAFLYYLDSVSNSASNLRAKMTSFDDGISWWETFQKQREWDASARRNWQMPGYLQWALGGKKSKVNDDKRKQNNLRRVLCMEMNTGEGKKPTWKELQTVLYCKMLCNPAMSHKVERVHGARESTHRRKSTRMWEDSSICTHVFVLVYRWMLCFMLIWLILCFLNYGCSDNLCTLLL